MSTFDEGNEAKVEYKTIKFGKVGDWFEGTLIDNVRRMKNELSPTGTVQTVFEFRAIDGSLHLIHDKVADKEATKITKGEEWSLITDKPAMLNRLKKASLGQKIGLKFIEEKPAQKKGHNPAKIVKIFIGDLDPEYKEEDGMGGY